MRSKHIIGCSHFSNRRNKAIRSCCNQKPVISDFSSISQDQFEIIKTLQREGIQGYLFGRPMPLSDFCRFPEEKQNKPKNSRTE